MVGNRMVLALMVALAGCALDEEEIGEYGDETAGNGSGDGSGDGSGGGSEEGGEPLACVVDGLASGAVQWDARYPEEPNSINAAMVVATAPDCTAIVAGRMQGVDVSSWSMFVNKYDNEGALVWETVIEDDDQRNEMPHALAVDADGRIVITGYRGGSDDGASTIEMLWALDAGGTVTASVESDRGTAIAVNGNGEFVVGGLGAEGGFLRAFDANLALQWEVASEYTVTALDFGPAGYGVFSAVTEEAQVIGRVESDGTVAWTDVQTPASGFIATAGVAASDDGDLVGAFSGVGAVVRRYDPDGALVWSNDLDEGTNDVDVGPNGNVVVVGSTGDNVVGGGKIYSLDPDGLELWSTEFEDGTVSGWPGAGVALDEAGNAWFATGYEVPDTTQNQAWIVKIGG